MWLDAPNQTVFGHVFLGHKKNAKPVASRIALMTYTNALA